MRCQHPRMHLKSPTPMELRQMEQARLYRMVHPTYWLEWIAIAVLLLVVATGATWIGVQVIAWAQASPTARLLGAGLSS